MAGGPTMGGAADRGLGALVRRIENLAREVADLRSARTLEAATIQQGGIQIVNGGTVKVVDSDGHTVAIIGALPDSYNRADGSPQPGLAFYREDGTLAALLGDGNATVPPYKQSFQIYDRAGRVVIADDTNSGHGLASPHIDNGGMENTNSLTWPATSNTTFTTIANKFMEIQNPVLSWQFQLFADVGITAQYKLLVNSVQVGTTQTVAANTFAAWYASAALPVGVSVGDVPLIELQAKASAGTASARAVCLRLAGANS